MPRWTAKQFALLDKDTILMMGNGMGGGHLVRDGVPFLDAYARALGAPRSVFIAGLRQADGEVRC